MDVLQFTDAARAGNWRSAVALWTGPFLPGCEDVGIEGFRNWLEVERERLRRLLAHCYEQAVAEGPEGDLLAVTSPWIRHLPMDEAAHRHHVDALCATGRVAEADAARAAFIARVQAEFEELPSDEWLAHTEAAVRNGRAVRQATPRPSVVTAEVPSPVTTRVPSRRAWSLRIAGVAAVAASAVLAFALARGQAATSGPPALALGEITSALPRDSVRGFATLLTIDLARIEGLNVISERRLSEAGAPSGARSVEAIARAAGARELLEGVLTQGAGNTLRADLRRVDIATGGTRAAYTVEAGTLTGLADLVTEQVARELGVRAPASRREAVTGSIVGYRLYEQGLRAYHDGDAAAARRFFDGALAEDSAFAMAAFYNALAIGGDGSDAYFARAARLAQRTSDRERLLINATWGRRMSDPRVLAWAETLVTRYPSESEAHLIYAREMLERNSLAPSLAQFRMVVEMDSLAMRTSPSCRACEGLVGMIEVYSRLDSLRAAEPLARTLVRWRPHSPESWVRLSRVLGEQGRFPEAHAAIDSATRLSSETDAALEHTVWWFRTNAFEDIDRMWRELLRSPKPDVRMNALWTGVLSMRTQGRAREALALARRYRRESIALGRGVDPDLGAALPEALALMDAGQPRAAALLFDSVAHVPQEAAFPSRGGAHRAMYYANAAAAFAQAGDTTRLAALEDSVRVNGALATERHQRLHHFVRGLRLAARAQHAAAAGAFAQAQGEQASTYVRIRLELARSLLAAGRPAEAIAPLTFALKGPTSASGLYATRTELQELLGMAYQRIARRDSAAAQYRVAAEAWRSGDPAYVQRARAIESALR